VPTRAPVYVPVILPDRVSGTRSALVDRDMTR
jgi:hypothetical protein